MTVSQALEEGRSLLRSVLNDAESTPELDARVLLQHVLSLSHAELISRAHQTIEDSVLQAYRSLVDRRVESFPVAYLVGRKEFMGLDFAVEEGVLIPRPDTETLVEYVLNEVRKSDEYRSGKKIRIVDVCTGTGCIAVSLAYYLGDFVEVAACDISSIALRVARANALALVPQKSCIVLESDLLSNVPGTWDWIVSNPPYLTPQETSERIVEKKWKEPALALDGGSSDGLELIRRLIEHSKNSLRPSGRLALEADPRQMEEIGRILTRSGFEQIQTISDLAGLERVICAVKSD